MEYIVEAIIPDPDNIYAVFSDRHGKCLAIQIHHESSIDDISLQDKILFDWKPYGPGTAKNITKDKDIHLIVMEAGLTRQEAKEKHFPSFPA